MLQLTFRRFLRELDEAPRGNNLQYILKCPCIPFFGNQRLHNKIVLGGNRGCSGVMCEGSPYSNYLKFFFVNLSYDGKYPLNNIISFIFYIITNFSLLNSCCLLLQDHNVDQLLILLLFRTQYKYSSSYIRVPQFID